MNLQDIVAQVKTKGMVHLRGLLRNDQTYLTEIRLLIQMTSSMGKYLRQSTSTCTNDELPSRLKPLLSTPPPNVIKFEWIPGGLDIIKPLLASSISQLAYEYLGTDDLGLVHVDGRPSVDVNDIKNLSIWHQDFPFYKRGRGLTAWVALEPCGEYAPGLKFLVPRQGEMRVLEVLDQVGDTLTLTDDAVSRLMKTHTVYAPKIDIGDVFLFDGYAPHGASTNEKMTKTRTSLEIRWSPKRPNAQA